MMTPGDAGRWERIAALFGAALERTDSERAGFLAAECGADEALLREVEALLACEGDAERLLGESVSGYAAPVFADPAGAEADPSGRTESGRAIGAYRVLREIGRGGMGAVYLAERADEQFRKQVALKLVKRGMDTDEVLRRFRYERQILASLEHPNVARLLDGGVTDDGLPYIVMEYVPGRPIDRYVDERRLTIEERLALFGVVCEAVQYAHQNLVVHRDIKPSNILITDDGAVKLLDFGIAKLLEDGVEGGGDGATEAPRTRTGLRIMTPEHAAPEQIRGGAITTATDVYALGVLLYQMLTGRRPFKAAGRSGRELEDAVLQEEPERPSAAAARADAAVLAARRVPADRLRRRLRGDLDLILLKALEKDPARRYQSAQQLLDDLDRHRRGLPVRARPVTAAYRLRKFARRHRAGLAAGAAALLVAAGFAGFHSARITGERDRARSEAEKARASTEFLQRLLGDAYPSVALGDTFSMGDLLLRAEARIDSLAARPELQAELLRTLGDVYREQGRFPEALRLIERAVALHRRSPESRGVAAGNALSALGHLRYQMKDFEEALRAHREELEIFQAVVAPDDSLVLYAMNNIAAAASELGRYDEALALHQEVLARRRRLFGDSSALVHVTRNNLGHLHHQIGDLEAAEREYREALAIRRAVLRPDHPSIALTLQNLALVRKDQNQLGEAEALLREALAGSRRILGADHPQVGLVAYSLAGVLRKSGRMEEAESLYRVTLAIDRKSLGDDHLEVGIDLHGLGKLLSEKGDCAAATGVFREAQAIFDKQRLPRGHRRQVANRGAWGACLATLERFPEAEPLLVASYQDAKAADTTAGSETVREALERLVSLYQSWGRSGEAAGYRVLLSGSGPTVTAPALRP